MAEPMFIQSVLTNFKDIEKALLESKIVEDAKDSILKRLDNVEISTEERDKLYTQYLEQLTLGVMQQALNSAMQLPITEKDIAIKEKDIAIKEEQKAETVARTELISKQKDDLEKDMAIKEEQKAETVARTELINIQKGEAVYKKLQALAVLKKQYGYINATETELGESSNKGLIDKQIAGFDKDAYHKLNADLAGVQQMLAQNDIEVPEWQVDTMRLLIEFLTDGKIDVNKGSGGTTVSYRANATSPNGL